MEGVTTGRSFAGAGQDERCLPSRVGDECFAQRLRIQAGLLLQGPKLATGIGEDASQGQLTGVGMGVHPEGVAGLGADLEPPGLALPPDSAHSIYVAVDPVDAMAVDVQPATTVHPRSPAAWLGDLHRSAGQLGRQHAQSGGIQRWPVVQPQVVVGIGVVRTPRPAASQRHTDDATDIGQSVRDLHQTFHEPQSAAAVHRPRPNCPAGPRE